MGQHVSPVPRRCRVRRVQGVGLRPRNRPAGAAQLPAGQERVGQPRERATRVLRLGGFPFGVPDGTRPQGPPMRMTATTRERGDAAWVTFGGLLVHHDPVSDSRPRVGTLRAACLRSVALGASHETAVAFLQFALRGADAPGMQHQQSCGARAHPWRGNSSSPPPRGCHPHWVHECPAGFQNALGWCMSAPQVGFSCGGRQAASTTPGLTCCGRSTCT